jgi:hypothetical protein
LLAFGVGDWATGWVMAAAASKSMGPFITRVVTRIARYG